MDLIGEIAERFGNHFAKHAPAPISEHVLLIRLKDSERHYLGNAQWITIQSAREAMHHCTSDSGESLSGALVTPSPNSFWVVVYFKDTQESELILLSRPTAKGGTA